MKHDVGYTVWALPGSGWVCLGCQNYEAKTEHLWSCVQHVLMTLLTWPSVDLPWFCRSLTSNLLLQKKPCFHVCSYNCFLPPVAKRPNPNSHCMTEGQSTCSEVDALNLISIAACKETSTQDISSDGSEVGFTCCCPVDMNRYKEW